MFRGSTGSTPDTPNSNSPLTPSDILSMRGTQQQTSEPYVFKFYRPVVPPGYSNDDFVEDSSTTSTATSTPTQPLPLVVAPVVAQATSTPILALPPIVPPAVATIVREYGTYLKQFAYNSTYPISRGQNLLNPTMYNQCDITRSHVEVWNDTAHPVRLRDVEVLTGDVRRAVAYYPTPIGDRELDERKYTFGLCLRFIAKNLIKEAKMEDLTIEKKRLFLIGYLTKSGHEAINGMYDVVELEERSNSMISNMVGITTVEQKRLFLIAYLTKAVSDVLNGMYLIAKQVESSTTTIPLSINGIPTTSHGKPKMVVINLSEYVPHTELELPHAMEQRATTCALFDHTTLLPIERNDNKMSYEKYPEFTVTIATVNEKREFNVRKFITNIDPGVSGIMIVPHYEDPQYGVVNGPNDITGACYMNLADHWMKMKVPDATVYNVEGLSVMYIGPFKPLRGIVGVIEKYEYPDSVVLLLESVVDYPENRLMVDSKDLVVIYRDFPDDLTRGEVVRRAWPSKLAR